MVTLTDKINTVTDGTLRSFVEKFYIATGIIMLLPMALSIFRLIADLPIENIMSVYWQLGTYLIVVLGLLCLNLFRHSTLICNRTLNVFLKDALGVGYIGVGVFSSIINAHPSTGSIYIVAGLISIGVLREFSTNLVIATIAYAIVFVTSGILDSESEYFYVMLLFGSYCTSIVVLYTVDKWARFYKEPLEETAETLDQATTLLRDMQEENANLYRIILKQSNK